MEILNRKTIMRKLAGFLLILVLFSCSDIVDKPKKLVSEQDMAVMIAELAINDQLGILVQGYNAENQTQSTFTQHKIAPKDFLDSYKYYTATNKIEKIFAKSQEVILEKDPKAKDYILKQIQGENASQRVLDERELQMQPQN